MGELPEIQIANEQLADFEPNTTVKFYKIGPVIKALAAAKKKFDIVKKSAENPLYKDAKGKARKYADINEIIAATTDALADVGLVIMQMPSMDGKLASMTTFLFHESGGWISAFIPGCPAFQRLKEGGERFDAQTIGIAFTYLARYGQGRLLNVGSEDDDGNSLKAEEKPRDFSPAPARVPEPSSESEQTTPVDADLALPTKEEFSAFATRIKALKQDSRLIKNFIQKKTGKPWNESTKKNLELAVSTLEAAFQDNSIQELIRSDI